MLTPFAARVPGNPLRSILPMLAVVLMVFGQTRSASAQKRREVEVVLEMIATGGVAGDLADPLCHAGADLRPSSFEAVAAHLEQSQQEASAPGSNANTEAAATEADANGSDANEEHLAPLRIDTGGLLARHGATRFAAEHNPAGLARLVEDLGYRALAFSEADLGDPRGIVLRRVRALRERNIPTLAHNLRCDESAAEVCAALTTAGDGVPLHRQGQEVVALFGLLDPEVRQRVGPDRVEGLHFGPLEESIRQVTRTARSRGATLVIAIIDAGEGADAAARALTAAAALDDADKPDLIIAAGAGSELLFARPRGFRPAIVSAPPMGAAHIEVHRNRSAGVTFMTQPIEPDEDAESPALRRFLASLGPAYCEAYGEHLPGGNLDPARNLDAGTMAELSAGILRERTSADIALLNVGAVEDRWHPSDPLALTGADVQIALPYDEPIMVAEVSAFWLKQLARSAPEDRDLISLGLTITGAFTALEKVKVNGRILDDNATYRVATLRFLAEGGDRHAVPDAEWQDTGLTLRQVVLDHLSEPREEDPRDSLVDPWDRLEWSLRAATDLTFSGSAVRDSGDYGEGPLGNDPQLQFGVNALIDLNARSRTAAWENQAQLLYTLASTSESDGFDEGSDQLTYRTTGLYRGFRANLDEVYVPDLLVEGLLRTELSPQDDQAHFLNVRLVGGLQWRPHLKVQLKLTGGFEILGALDRDSRAAEPGFGAQLNINPWILLREGLRKLTVTFNADYFVSGVGGRNRHLLQGLFDIEIGLNRYFSLGLNATLYGLSEDGSAFSFALQSAASLRINWVGRRVQRRSF